MRPRQTVRTAQLLAALLCLLAFLLVPHALPPLHGGSDKPDVTVRFFPEASAADTSTFSTPVQVPGFERPFLIKNIPTIYEKDIIDVKSFQAQDGTLGVMFLLSPHGRTTLELETAAHVGSHMICVVNGAPISALYIDRSISDGMIGIPRGLSFREIELFEKAFKPRK